MDISVNWRVDRNILNNISNGLHAKTEEAVEEAADKILAYVQTSWSDVSPSDPFNPPAVVTGALSESGEVVHTSIGTKSEFKVQFLAEYALYLELGTFKIAPRPFLQPAVDYVSDLMGIYFTVVFET